MNMCNMWEVLSMSEWKSAANAVAVNRWQDYSPNFKGSIATINLLKKPFYDLKKNGIHFILRSEGSLSFSQKPRSFYSV